MAAHVTSNEFQEAFEAKCRAVGLRVTKERQRVFEALRAQPEPVTRAALFGQLEAEGMHPPTLYRTIDAFVAAQIVQAISLGGELGYELLPPFSPHHHHFHCLVCKRVIGYEVGTPVEPDEGEVPGRVLYHQVDVYGICDACEGAS